MTVFLLALQRNRATQLRSVFALVLLIGLFLAPVSATAKYASIVVDVNTGRILHATNADTRNYPASLTKMMTLYIVFDSLNAGEITLKTKFKTSRRATQQPPSRLGLRKNQTITVKNAILSLVTKSANDVAVVIAENLSGSERAFALKMTAKARDLGMSRTTFRNASGLPHRGQMSTARDMAKLARALLTTHSSYYGYFSIKKFTYQGRGYKNHNKLLTSYEGVDGIKTGYIRAAGYNLVASAKRSKQRLIGVVFGGNSSKHRNRHMTKLLNKGFASIDRGTGFNWTVQVGAFAQYKQAYEAAQTAVDHASSHLKNGLIKIIPLKKRNGRTLHRARILGVSKRQAYRSCKYLKKKRMNCMVISGKKAMQVASN